MLGEFGTPRPAVEEKFGWLGVPVRVHPDLSDLALIDIVRRVGRAEKQGDVQALVEAVGDLIDLLIHPEDVEVFWRVARENRQTTEDIAEVAMKLVGAMANRPTMRPSDSSAGPSTTEPSSTDGSTSPALRLLEGKGRPDLAVAVLRAEQARSA